ncbi:MAG: TrmH family RNA methyltransferase [Ilumatobacteraceae bacterium]
MRRPSPRWWLRPRRRSADRAVGNEPNLNIGITNPRVQRLRRLVGRRSSRSEEGVVVVEGPVLIAEAVAAGWTFECQFVAPGADPVTGAGEVLALAEGVIDKVASTETPQGVIAIAARPESSRELLRTATFVVVADGVADPGNLGTMMRSAEAAGADLVIVTPGTVDPTSPKTVRSSAGAVFRIPVLEVESLETLRASGLVVVGTSSHRGIDFARFDVPSRVAVVMGSEAHGLADDVTVDEWVTIPHVGRAESLNVAMACTLLCFEVARRRRDASGTV